MRSTTAERRTVASRAASSRRRARVLGILLSTLGWALGLASILEGGALGLLFPLVIGVAIAIRLADATPFWRRATFWSGIAMACSTAVSMLAALALYAFSAISPAPQPNAPATPPDATIVTEQRDPSLGDVDQRGLLFVPAPGDDETVHAFYDQAHSPAAGWIAQHGLNSGDWCWMRAGSGDEWEATVLTRAPSVGGFAVTNLRLGPEFFRLPAYPSPADCAMLIGTVAD